MRKGVTYDTGFLNLGTTTREHFEPADVERDMAAIAGELGCAAVRVTGGDPARLETAARIAAAHGLEVWFSPFPCDLDEDATLEVLLDCAERAERVRREGATVVFTTGAELALVGKGYIAGETLEDRLATMFEPGRLPGLIGLIAGPLNAFLARAVAAVRERFGGPVSYAAIPFERVDWALFDYAGYDLYRMTAIAERFPGDVRAIAAGGVPLAVTETGCATYKGASGDGAQAGMIVEYTGGRATGLHRPAERDEEEQAACVRELLELFDEAGADIVFVCVFACWHLPHRTDGRPDLDLGSYGIVAVDEDGRTWRPKAAFHAVAGYGRGSTGTDA
ncbi:hypothetical protein Afil01_26020 [Actinorhabdospora filicis]|uniref:Uncharacterized protein n=1 Tax=Actinorhabdospora filicis TaxID=1785913 RepID=A0A9W6WAM3_9ACTN|nr:hypothetical protein [Actinorhabdospora filicis]GLZ77795.1 hypothetical protein Afil01_26020 [Actinorhabdospora filicis]